MKNKTFKKHSHLSLSFQVVALANQSPMNNRLFKKHSHLSLSFQVVALAYQSAMNNKTFKKHSHPSLSFQVVVLSYQSSMNSTTFKKTFSSTSIISGRGLHFPGRYRRVHHMFHPQYVSGTSRGGETSNYFLRAVIESPMTKSQLTEPL